MQSDLAMWTLIVGFLVPIVTAVVIRAGWSSGLRSFANFVIAAIASLGTVYFKGDLDTSNRSTIISSFLLVFVTSIAAYHGFWGQNGVAPSVEAATGGRPADQPRSTSPTP